MKSRLTALLLTLALLLTALPVCAAAEETSSTRMPLYDVFPLQLDDNTVLELPIGLGLSVRRAGRRAAHCLRDERQRTASDDGEDSGGLHAQ